MYFKRRAQNTGRNYTPDHCFNDLLRVGLVFVWKHKHHKIKIKIIQTSKLIHFMVSVIVNVLVVAIISCLAFFFSFKMQWLSRVREQNESLNLFTNLFYNKLHYQQCYWTNIFLFNIIKLLRHLLSPY